MTGATQRVPATRRERLRLWWLRRGRVARVLLVSLVVVVVCGGVVVGAYVSTHCAWGVDRTGGQCIGLLDGSDPGLLGADVKPALRAIGEENARVAAEQARRPSVTIGYVMPLAAPGVDDQYDRQLVGDLMGVAVAQRQANRTNTLGDGPAIRVLVANVGDSSDPHQEPIDQLIEMSRDRSAPSPLLAVAVTGKSLEPLTRAIDTMLAAKVPVILSHLTAEQVTSGPVPPDTSLARVAPTTADEAAAAAAYLRSTNKHHVLIVQNTDQQDRYAQSLGAAFRASFADPARQYNVEAPDETYVGSADGVGIAMKNILRDICLRRPDAVWFAGRSPELAKLVAQLPLRPCLGQPFEILTGDDGAGFAASVARGDAELSRGLQANASVAYIALAHPQAWDWAKLNANAADQATKDLAAAFPPNSAAFLTGGCADCFPKLFPGRSLDDSYAIMAYDAMLTMIDAIRSGGPASSPSGVVQQLKQIHGSGLVAGASGWISLRPDGYPNHKAVSIVGVRSDGRSDFVRLSAPDGKPCTPNDPSC